ncbi:hypothetical protein ACWEIJ_08480 [Lentzea sp. NPDC004789]
MWGFLVKLLAVIGVLASAVVTASAFVPGVQRLPEWLAQTALVVAMVLFTAMLVREHGGFPDRKAQREIWAAWWKTLPVWVRPLVYAIGWGCAALAVYTFFTGTHLTNEQFIGITGPIALGANVNVLAFAFVRRREAPAA